MKFLERWYGGRKPPPEEALDEEVRQALTSMFEPDRQAMVRVEEALSEPRAFLHREPLGSGYSGSEKVLLENGLVAVWKPLGEEPQLARRECAAYLLDKMVGHMFGVLPTVLRRIDGEEGALLPYLPGAREAFRDPRRHTLLRYPSSPGYRRMAVLDLVVGNRDRHGGNWLFLPDSKVVPIDHGLAFPPFNGSQWYRAYDFWVDVDLDHTERDSLAALLAQPAPLREQLEPLIGTEALEALLERTRRACELGRTYPWQDEGVSAERTRFLDLTGLDRSRPEHNIRLTVPLDYEEMLKHVEVHRYYMGLNDGHRVSLEEAAASWHDEVYRPVLEAVHESGLMQEFPRRTAADLYRWITYHREVMSEQQGARPSDLEVARSLADDYSERPLVGLWRTVVRAFRAAQREVKKSLEPPRQAP